MVDKNNPINALTEQLATLISQLVTSLTRAAIQAQSPNQTPSEEGTVDASQGGTRILPQTSDFEDFAEEEKDPPASIEFLGGPSGEEAGIGAEFKPAEEPEQVGAEDLFSELDLTREIALTDSQLLDRATNPVEGESTAAASFPLTSSEEAVDPPVLDEEPLQPNEIFPELDFIEVDVPGIPEFLKDAIAENVSTFAEIPTTPEPIGTDDFADFPELPPSIEEMLREAEVEPIVPSRQLPFEVPSFGGGSVLPFLPEVSPPPGDDDTAKIEQLFREMLGVNEESHLIRLVSTLGQMREQTEMYIERVEHELTQTTDVLSNSTMRVVYLETERERMRSF